MRGIGPEGRSPLYVTKSSDEGHDHRRWSLPLTSAKSVVRDKVLRRGALAQRVEVRCMNVGYHRPCAMTPSIPLLHDIDEGDEAEAAAATTSLTAFVTNEDAPLTLPIHPY